jgi:hypothetical protein
LDFFQSSGPGIKLIDTQTKRETYLPTAIANFDFKEKYTTIQPGKTLTVEELIYTGDLDQFGGPGVDVSAEVIITADILVDGKHVNFIGSDTIHIVSKDKQ